jgi:membrane-associated phospholipid phosphatase
MRPLPAQAPTSEPPLGASKRRWLSQPFFSLIGGHWREVCRLVIMELLAGAALIAFFAVLEDVVNRDPLVRIDQAIFHVLQSLRTGPLDRVMVAITELGDWVVTTAVTMVALFWFIWHRNRRMALYLGAVVLGPSILSFLMKLTLRVARPIDLYSGWDSYSFPSGHVAVNAALYGFVTVLIACEETSWRRLGAIAFTATVVLFLAFSRLYLGAHFLSDVLAGLSFSTAWVALLTAGYLHGKSRAVGTTGLTRAIALTIILVGGAYVYHRYPLDMQRYVYRNW